MRSQYLSLHYISMDVHAQYLNTTAIVSVLILLVLITCFRAFKQVKQPPKASGGWPIFGHLHLLGGPKLPHETLATMSEKYGPIFTIKYGFYETVVISSWEVAKECFTKNDVAVSSRPKLMGGKHLGYNYANFSLAPYGSYWREIRKITTHELFSNRRLDLLKHIREEEVESSIRELYRFWHQKEKSGSGHVMFEMRNWFSDLTLNVILRMLVGKGYNWDGSKVKESKARRCQKVIKETFRLVGLFVMEDAIPFSEWLDLGGHVKAMKANAKEIDAIFEEWLEEHQEKKECNGGKGEQDFMDVLITILGESKIADFDANTVNKATIMSLAAGGIDTVAVALIWGLSLLLNNQHVLKKAQDELDMHIGKQRVVKESDISKLVYIQAIVKEVLRLYPPGPLVHREFTQDCTIASYHIAAGTRLIVNLHKIHRDPRIWEEPFKFMPERFLTTHKDIDVKGQHFELCPFGSGRRACPASNYAVQIVQFALASLVHAFDMSTPNNEPLDMSGTVGLTVSKATPVEVLLKPRLSPSNYN